MHPEALENLCRVGQLKREPFDALSLNDS